VHQLVFVSLTGKPDVLSLGNASYVGSHLAATCSLFRREHSSPTNTVLMAGDFIVVQTCWCEEQRGGRLQSSVPGCSQPDAGDDAWRISVLPQS